MSASLTSRNKSISKDPLQNITAPSPFLPQTNNSIIPPRFPKVPEKKVPEKKVPENNGTTGSPPAISLRIRCEFNANFCQKAQRAIRRAAERICSEIRFMRKTVIEVTLFLPCGQVSPNPATCPDAEQAGYATPAQHIPVRHRDDNQVYLYPTSLLKQTNIEGVEHISWAEYDIVAKFNAVLPWYFPENGEAMRPPQRDFELVVTRELLRGFGYGNDLIMTYQPDRKLNQLIPHFNTYPGEIMPLASPIVQPRNGLAFVKFSGPSIWNRFTFFNGKPILNRYATFTKILQGLKKSHQITKFQGNEASMMLPLPGQCDSDSVVNALRNDALAKLSMEQMFKEMTTEKSLEFRADAWPPKTPIRSKQILDTAPPFAPSKTGSYLTKSELNTPEFLMSVQADSKTFSELIANSKAPKSGIGPATKNALLAMGFSSAEGNVNSRKEFAMVESLARNKLGPPSFPKEGILPKITNKNEKLTSLGSSSQAIPSITLWKLAALAVIKILLSL
jgi:hypothetical protein